MAGNPSAGIDFSTVETFVETTMKGIISANIDHPLSEERLAETREILRASFLRRIE